MAIRKLTLMATYYHSKWEENVHTTSRYFWEADDSFTGEIRGLQLIRPRLRWRSSWKNGSRRLKTAVLSRACLRRRRRLPRTTGASLIDVLLSFPPVKTKKDKKIHS